MYRRFLVFSSKILIKLLRLTGTSGSALPGLIMEKLYPNFLNKVLAPVEKQIILVTGTNGKTTTTKMIVAALEGDGARVVTNGTGSNMTRGLIAALVDDMTYFGGLKPADWYIFEMDEAYAPIFTKHIAPRALLALNVLRDQLDRYGEIDTTAKFIAQAAAQSSIFVYNALDPLLYQASMSLKKSGKTVVSFGVAGDILQRVVNEQTLHNDTSITNDTESDVSLLAVSEMDHRLSVTLRVNGNTADGRVRASLPLQGFHNALNVTAVAALLREVAPDAVVNGLKAISTMETPFGRGERLVIGGKNISVALVKNPSGFTSNLQTFVQGVKPDLVVFLINDNIADGRDVSWLWDVKFRGVMSKKTTLLTSGVRGFDMAVRLQQDGYRSECITSVQEVVDRVLDGPAKEVVIIPTYTALFEVRAALSKYGKVARIW